MRKFLVVPALLGGIAVAASGCQMGKTVTADKVERQITDKFGPVYDAAGIGPASADCPDDLKGEVGATLDCTVKDGKGTTHRMTVTVTSVDGDQVRFTMKAAQ